MHGPRQPRTRSHLRGLLQRNGVVKDEAELTQEERRQRRAKKKRIAARKTTEKEAATGIATHAKGIKSARAEAQAAKDAKAMVKRAKADKYVSSRSGNVFKQLAEEQAAGGAAVVRRNALAAKRATDASAVKSAQLKM